MGTIPERERELQVKSSRFRRYLEGTTNETGGIRMS